MSFFVRFMLRFKKSKQHETTEKKVMIVTDYGNMVLKLYNKTPLHRNNFIKLVKEHFYDSLLISPGY